MFTEFDLPLQTKNITIPNTLQGTLTYVTHVCIFILVLCIELISVRKFFLFFVLTK